MTFEVFDLFIVAFGVGALAGIAGLAIGVRGERRRWTRRAKILGVPAEDLLETDDPAVAFSRGDRSEQLERQIAILGQQIERLGQAVASRELPRDAARELRSPIPPA